MPNNLFGNTREFMIVENQDISGRLTQGKTPSKRIEFIDAMRGFTIFLVVLDHVALLCLNINSSVPSINNYLIQVRMPMFFLISGFVLYKEGVVWNASHIVRFFKKKIPVQLLSPLLFFVVYMHLNGYNILEGFLNEPKYGYWFTYALFIYFVIYASVRFFLRGVLAEIVLLLIGICLLAAGWPPFIVHIPVPENVLWFLSFPHWQYFLYFVLGTLVKKYFDQVQHLLDGKWLLPICVAVYFLGNAFSDMVSLPNAIIRLPFTLTGLVILFAFFRNKQKLFSSSNRLGRTMLYVGRRTLDVYLLHYFLLPVNLAFVTVFVDHPMPIVEFFVSSVISLLIIAMCLLISNIIRLSPFLAHWIFGVKRS